MSEPQASSVDVSEATLPGVGKKYTIGLRSGGNLALVIKPDGQRQMYHFQEAEDRPCDVIKLDRDESQQVANLLGQLVVTAPKQEKLALMLGALEIEWLELNDASPLVGKSLDEVRLRSATGASVAAIMRGELAIPNPNPSEVFKPADTVVIIGSHEQCGAARVLILGSP